MRSKMKVLTKRVVFCYVVSVEVDLYGRILVGNLYGRRRERGEGNVGGQSVRGARRPFLLWNCGTRVAWLIECVSVCTVQQVLLIAHPRCCTCLALPCLAPISLLPPPLITHTLTHTPLKGSARVKLPHIVDCLSTSTGTIRGWIGPKFTPSKDSLLF